MPLAIASPEIGDLRQVCIHLSHLLIEVGVRFVSMDLRGLGESSIDWADNPASIAPAILRSIGRASAL